MEAQDMSEHAHNQAADDLESPVEEQHDDVKRPQVDLTEVGGGETTKHGDTEPAEPASVDHHVHVNDNDATVDNAPTPLNSSSSPSVPVDAWEEGEVEEEVPYVKPTTATSHTSASLDPVDETELGPSVAAAGILAQAPPGTLTPLLEYQQGYHGVSYESTSTQLPKVVIRDPSKSIKTSDDIRRHFEAIGGVQGLTWSADSGSGDVTLADLATLNAVFALPEHTIGDTTLIVSPMPPPVDPTLVEQLRQTYEGTGVHLSNVMHGMTEDVIKAEMSCFGVITSIRRCLKPIEEAPYGYGFVNYATSRQAAHALSAGTLTIHGVEVKVSAIKKDYQRYPGGGRGGRGGRGFDGGRGGGRGGRFFGGRGRGDGFRDGGRGRGGGRGDFGGRGGGRGDFGGRGGGRGDFGGRGGGRGDFGGRSGGRGGGRFGGGRGGRGGRGEFGRGGGGLGEYGRGSGPGYPPAQPAYGGGGGPAYNAPPPGSYDAPSYPSHHEPHQPYGGYQPSSYHQQHQAPPPSYNAPSSYPPPQYPPNHDQHQHHHAPPPTSSYGQPPGGYGGGGYQQTSPPSYPPASSYNQPPPHVYDAPQRSYESSQPHQSYGRSQEYAPPRQPYATAPPPSSSSPGYYNAGPTTQGYTQQSPPPRSYGHPSSEYGGYPSYHQPDHRNDPPPPSYGPARSQGSNYRAGPYDPPPPSSSYGYR